MLTPEKAFFSGGGFGLFKFGVPSYNVGVHSGSCRRWHAEEQVCLV